LISDLDAGQRTLGHELQYSALVEAQVSSDLTAGHQSITKFQRNWRGFTENV
jgi:hypothetical protein